MARVVVGLDIGHGVLRAAEVANPAKPRPTLLRYHEMSVPHRSSQPRRGHRPRARRAGPEGHVVARQVRHQGRRARHGQPARALARLQRPRSAARPHPRAAALPGAGPAAGSGRGCPARLLPDLARDDRPGSDDQRSARRRDQGRRARQRRGGRGGRAARGRGRPDPVRADPTAARLARARPASRRSSTSAPRPPTWSWPSAAFRTSCACCPRAAARSATRSSPSTASPSTTPSASSASSVSRRTVVTPEQRPVIDTIHGATGELLGSVRNTISYFVNSRPNMPVTQLMLSGGGADMPGIREAFADLTRLPSPRPTRSRTWRSPSPSPSDGLRTARSKAPVAIGLAVGSVA